jgi:hypothetical protein
MHNVFFPADSKIPLSRSAWNGGSSQISRAVLLDTSLDRFDCVFVMVCRLMMMICPLLGQKSPSY